MTLRSILVPAANKLDLEGPLDAALALARRLQAHLDVLHVSAPARLIEEYLPHPLPFDPAVLEERARAEERSARASFETWCAANEVLGKPAARLLGSTFARWRAVEDELDSAVSRAGRLSDLIVVNRPRSGDLQASRCFDAAVFSAGRPTLLVPRRKMEQPLRHVLVAWNGSLESMHAVALCLDLLHSAESVSIFTAASARSDEEAGDELVAALRWHGIEAARRRDKGGAGDVGDSLLRVAEEANASLVVMGAYTHSRLREALLGGVTRRLLFHGELPVIMAH